MSTAFHPQMDGATKRANRSVGQILRSVIQPNQSDWVDKIAIVEFAINSNISSSTGFAPFELNYGYLPTLIGGITTTENAKPGVCKFINQVINNLEEAHDAIIESRVRQTLQANRCRRADAPYNVGEQVYLSTDNLNLPKNRSRKLMPKYIGPYKITQSYPNESRYTLDLPPESKARRIHLSFHVSRLHTFNMNDDNLFPRREARAYYDFSKAEDNEWLVDEIIAHQWKGTKVSFLVQWNLGDTTWEPYSECKDLMALDRYLELLGIEGKDWHNLPRKALVKRHRYAYETPISRVPALISTSPLGLVASIPPSPASPPLSESDFPNISFWTQEKW